MLIQARLSTKFCHESSVLVPCPLLTSSFTYRIVKRGVAQNWRHQLGRLCHSDAEGAMD